MDCNAQGLRSQVFMNATQAIKLKICGFDHAHDVLIQRQVDIQQDTQILGRGACVDDITANTYCWRRYVGGI